MKKIEISEKCKTVIVIATGIILCACVCFGYKAYEKHQRIAAMERANKAAQQHWEIQKACIESYLERAELTGDATWNTTPPETNKEKENNGQN